MRYYIVSLGCPKNSVDAEDMCLLLNGAGHTQVLDPARADVLLVNTCGFIESARDESVQVLQELGQSKRPGQRLIAAGCLSQRAGAQLALQVPDLDGILGTRRWAEVLDVAAQVAQRRRGQPIVACVDDPPLGSANSLDLPRTANLGASAYLKIAEGCSAPCAFCAIPLIKGPLKSRPQADIVADARYLAEQGVQEVILIAQDTTAYGQIAARETRCPTCWRQWSPPCPKYPGSG